MEEPRKSHRPPANAMTPEERRDAVGTAVESYRTHQDGRTEVEVAVPTADGGFRTKPPTTWERREMDIAGMALVTELLEEVDRQDEKHGPFEGSALGRSRLGLACVQDELAEALDAWRAERPQSDGYVDLHTCGRTRAELLQVAAVALRVIRDCL